MSRLHGVNIMHRIDLFWNRPLIYHFQQAFANKQGKWIQLGIVNEFGTDPDVYLGSCSQCVEHLKQDTFNIISSFIYIPVGIVC